uniref:Uncharacterized protein n=1 Tax=Neospora caninum (strain Liverpool) TaxID=572307 RepID=A0A0F7UF89_NEOCL|nr:TPA: hypothetical protein BN1204_035080 [Neospora caninum Liverpool]
MEPRNSLFHGGGEEASRTRVSSPSRVSSSSQTRQPSYLRFVRAYLPKGNSSRRSDPASSSSSSSRSSSTSSSRSSSSSSSRSSVSSACSALFASVLSSSSHVRRGCAPLSRSVSPHEGAHWRGRSSARSAKDERQEEPERGARQDDCEEERARRSRTSCKHPRAEKTREDALSRGMSPHPDAGTDQRRRAENAKARTPSRERERQKARHRQLERRAGSVASCERRKSFRERASSSESSTPSADSVYTVERDTSEAERSQRRSKEPRRAIGQARRSTGRREGNVSSRKQKACTSTPEERPHNRMQRVGSSSSEGRHDSEDERSSDGSDAGERAKRVRRDCERSPNLPPRAPRNPLFAAYDRASYQELKRRRREASGASSSRRQADNDVDREQWRHDRFHERSPSPERVRPPTVWDTRKGQWRSRAGGVYVPPPKEEVEELEEALARYRPSPRGNERSKDCSRSKDDRHRRESRDSSPSPVRRGSPVYE